MENCEPGCAECKYCNIPIGAEPCCKCKHAYASMFEWGVRAHEIDLDFLKGTKGDK